MGGCVWYGNDDNEPMNNMTGGTLPAGTWHDVMAYAHQGVPLKPIVGLKPEAKPDVAAASGAARQAARARRARSVRRRSPRARCRRSSRSRRRRSSGGAGGRQAEHAGAAARPTVGAMKGCAA